MRIDSQHHVSATHRAKEERQDAQLLERGREQASRRRPGGAAARAVSGRDQFLAGGGLAQGDRSVRRGYRPCRGRWRCFPRIDARPRRRCVDRSASPVGDAASSSAAMGRLLAGRAVVAGACSSIGSGPIGCRRAARARAGIRSCRFWSTYRLIAPGSEWRLHRRMVWQAARWPICWGRISAWRRRTSSTPATICCWSTRKSCSRIWSGAGAICSTPTSTCCCTI